MPIYEYRCEACGHTLDALQKINDPHLTDCPACHEKALKRLMSAPSFRLKGGGWYETDFKSDKDKKRNLVDGKSDGGDSSGSSASGKDAGGDKSGGDKSSGDKKAGADAKASGGKSDKPKSSGSGSEAA